MVRPSKRSIAAKKRWAAKKAQKKYNELNSPKSHSSPADLVARMKNKKFTLADYNEKILKPMIAKYEGKEWKINDLGSDINVNMQPTSQTRLDIIFHDLEIAMQEVITKLKGMF